MRTFFSEKWPKMKKNEPDWAAIERELRAGLKSRRQIAREFGVPESTLRLKAKREGWGKPRRRKRKQCEPAPTSVRGYLMRELCAPSVARSTKHKIALALLPGEDRMTLRGAGGDDASASAAPLGKKAQAAEAAREAAVGVFAPRPVPRLVIDNTIRKER
jgi:hypothetical protein